MRLTATDALARLAAHDHGVLCTVHPTRGVDAVPCVYALAGDVLGVPVDRVKAKAARPLQRERNLAADPRAALLIEHWDRDDWSRLWWVRAELRRADTDAPADADGPAGDLAARLARAFPQYRDQPFDRILVFRVVSATGWAAG